MQDVLCAERTEHETGGDQMVFRLFICAGFLLLLPIRFHPFRFDGFLCTSQTAVGGRNHRPKDRQQQQMDEDIPHVSKIGFWQ